LQEEENVCFDDTNNFYKGYTAINVL